MRTIIVAAAALALAGCKVRVNDTGKPPEVDVHDSAGVPQVDVKPGRAPDVQVKTDSVHLPEVKAPEIKPPNVHLPEVHPGGGHVSTDTAHHR